jgi:hypothetical protein
MAAIGRASTSWAHPWRSIDLFISLALQPFHSGVRMAVPAISSIAFRNARSRRNGDETCARGPPARISADKNPLPSDHRLRDLAGQEKGSTRLDREVRFPFLLGRLDHRDIVDDHGAVDHDVDAAELLLDSPDEVCNVCAPRKSTTSVKSVSVMDPRIHGNGSAHA